MYLLDTNVVAAISPRERRFPADDLVAAWIESNSDELWLSVITAAEIEDGIAKASRTGATRKAQDLSEWWQAIAHYYANRILPVDLEAASIAGKLMDVARAGGISPGFEDIAIAATAKRHGLTVLTRNVKDFKPLGVAFIDPFERLP
jgi:predicted nucleic acid-binding protein